MNFLYRSMASHAVFGPGTAAQLPDVLQQLGSERVLFICTASGVDRYRHIHEQDGGRVVALFSEAESHCPQPVVDKAISAFEAANADTVVTVGGGSTLGLGKILKAEHGAKLAALPTTYSGSEMTPIYGRKIDGQKRTRVDQAAVPSAVIYDPELTFDLPAEQTAATGMNSIAHAVEGLYPAQPNPINFDLVQTAIRLHARALPICVRDPRDLAARTDALYAAFLGGLSVAMVGVALHHALGHVIGGLYELEHGDYNSVVLPHVAAFNAPAAPEAAKAVCDALGVDDPGLGLYDLARDIGAPASLKDLGMPEEGITAVASAMVAKGARNPRPIDLESMTRLMTAAYHGERCRVSDYD